MTMSIDLGGGLKTGYRHGSGNASSDGSRIETGASCLTFEGTNPVAVVACPRWQRVGFFVSRRHTCLSVTLSTWIPKFRISIDMVTSIWIECGPSFIDNFVSE